MSDGSGKREKRMKNFNYTARDTTGALKRGDLMAADRIAALQELRSRGMVPVSVMDGKAARSHALPRFTAKRAAVALAGVAVVAVVGVWLMIPGKTPSAAKPAPPARNQPSVRPEPPRTQSAAVASPVQPALKQTVAVPPAAQPTKEVSPAAAAPRPSATPPPRRGETMQAVSTNQPRPSGYSSGTEAVINMIVNARLGTPPPPLPRLPRVENIAEILDRDIILYDDDSEKTATEKANVAYAKKLLKEYMQAGGKPEEFLQHYHAELTSAFDEWRAAQKYTRDLLNAGDREGAARYVDEQNKKFSEKGIRPIVMPLLKK